MANIRLEPGESLGTFRLTIDGVDVSHCVTANDFAIDLSGAEVVVRLGIIPTAIDLPECVVQALEVDLEAKR